MTKTPLTPAAVPPVPPWARAQATLSAGLAAALDVFESAEPAPDRFAPLPPGTYRAVATAGRVTESHNGKARFSVTWRVTEGEYAGRNLWNDYYLTDAAVGRSRRDLAAFGLLKQADLVAGLPAGRFVCDVTTRITEYDGRERAEVRYFKVVEVRQDAAAAAHDPDFPPDAGGVS